MIPQFSYSGEIVMFMIKSITLEEIKFFQVPYLDVTLYNDSVFSSCFTKFSPLVTREPWTLSKFSEYWVREEVGLVLYSSLDLTRSP